MKSHMMSRAAMSHLFDHILDGYKSSHEGLKQLRHEGLVTDQELTDLLQKNSDRLIDRIKEFKIVHRIVSISFACLFAYMQMGCEDMEMRRARRVKTRRRHETENVISL